MEEVSIDLAGYEPDSKPSSALPGSEFLTSEMQHQIAGRIFEVGSTKAKEAFSIYGRIDILRPYFDVEPRQVQKRLITALIPERIMGTKADVVRLVYTLLNRNSSTKLHYIPLLITHIVSNQTSLSSELYGPLMVVLTLVAVMLAGMKSSGQTVQEGTLMGTAIGTCFGYWLGASTFFFGLAYFCDTRLSPIEVGYSEWSLWNLRSIDLMLSLCFYLCFDLTTISRSY